MKTILTIISSIILCLSLGEKICAQATSTQGTDFWLSFGRNRDHTYVEVNLQVRIVTSEEATVTFTYTESGATNTVNIPAGNVYTYTFNTNEKEKVYSRNQGTSSKSLHIESDVPVSVYALNQRQTTTDATNILPVTSLGDDYYHISYKSNSITYNDGYTVIATEDNTGIYEDNILKATLQKGQVYSAYFGAVDITGKHVTSTGPIAYFVTNGGVWLPCNLTNGSDCLYQQMVSVNKWGNNFLVPVTHRGIERVRIVASQDGTVITQSGGIIVIDTIHNCGNSRQSLNLDRGQFVELETSLNTCGCYISSNKPVGVCTYLVGEQYHPPVEKGDPSIAWVPPVEQSINGALITPFAPSGGSVLDEHFVLIVTPTATKNQTTMAIGTNPATGLTGGQWCDNTISNLSFYSLPLTNTNEAYFFANPYGLTVMGYGIGEYESYYYLAGSASRNLDAAFYINNIHYQDLNGGITCDTNINFRASIQYGISTIPGYLKWYVDGVEQIAVRDTLEWNGTLSIGMHNVYIDVLDMNNDTVRLSSAFGVDLSYHDTVSAEICLGDRYFDSNFDTIPAQAGFISCSLNHHTTIGCDSVFTLNLTVNSSYHDTINASI
ncbi:MAG: IgGFc-binding protein, partial [Prevotellaceae bacterium]|nr:IgGFc-binding protein [Prevotellaceae bacterium]